jgi:tRNA threonylcarbamoyladenosine biosynthesis protein TsaB
MIILTIRTDKPESEIGLYDSETQLAYETWEAHRQLAETIHNKIQALLESKSKKLKDIQGIVVYIGPGSFTGLRIGISVANALAYSLAVPIIGVTGSWIEDGIARIKAGENDKTVVPEYGAPVHVTTPKK